MAVSGLSLLLGAGVGVVAGVLIGCIGVGGVILVPLLILREDIGVHLAVVACMAAYVPAGLAGAAAYVRKGAVPWRSAVLMCLPAALSALLGAWTLVRLSARVVKLVLYAVMLATSCLSAARSAHSVYRERREDASATPVGESPADGGAAEHATGGDHVDDDNDGDVAGCSQDGGGGDAVCGDEVGVSDEQEWLVPGNSDGEDSQPGNGGTGVLADPSEKPSDEGNRCFGSMTGVQLSQALLVGTLAGFGSALTGTSGPVLLLPMLFILLWPALPALGCAQVIQVPIACAATIGNVFFATTQVDLHDVFKLGGCVAAGLVPFVFVGAAIANHLPQRSLKIVIAILLVVASLALLIKEVL